LSIAVPDHHVDDARHVRWCLGKEMVYALRPSNLPTAGTLSKLAIIPGANPVPTNLTVAPPDEAPSAGVMLVRRLRLGVE
jgi:hypothetical protein